MTRYADKDAQPPKVWRCSGCGQQWPRHDPDCYLRHVGPHEELEEEEGSDMTRSERIPAATETLERRAARLRTLVAMDAPRFLINEAMVLCTKGIADVEAALDSTDEPPPLVEIGQGDFEQVYPPRRLADD